MPYILRKKLVEVGKYPIRLQFKLPDNEKICQYYDLNHDGRYPTFFRTCSIIVVNKDFSVERIITNPYEFQIISVGSYVYRGNKQECAYDREVYLPQDLVKDYAIDSTMGLELHINEVVHKAIDENWKIISTSSESVFPKGNVEGSKDFEIKGISSQIVTNDLLLNTLFEDKFLDDLKFEINTAFRFGLYTATVVLVRKLFERQIIEVLRQKYTISRMELFYRDGYFLGLSELIRNLRDKLDDFKPYDFFKLEREKQTFIDFLWAMRDEGNAGAHSLPYLGYEEILELQPSINKYSDLLVRMYRKIKEIPE